MRHTIKNRMISLATFFLALVLLAISQIAFAQCENSLGLEGTVKLELCIPGDKCALAREVLHDYMSAAARKLPKHTLVLNIYASPWHLYDANMRVMAIEEIADSIKTNLQSDTKSIVLMGSWTGVAASPNKKSFAQKLSDAINGFPVTGMDGFLWIAKDGSLRTSHQAFTVTSPAKCPYGIHVGDEVMESLVPGWYYMFEEVFIRERDPEGVRRAAAGWDIFMLCPERALQSFETAAQLSDAISAYNAAIMRLERNKEGDFEKAVNHLKHAVALGDRKAKTQLEKLDQAKQDAGLAK